MSHSLSLAAQFFRKPLAIQRRAADMLIASLQNAVERDDRASRRYGLCNGVAIIPVQGVLATNVPWFCEGTSYNWIRAGFDCALQDPEVRAIVFDVNSPGGEVAGCFDLADHVYECRGIKPIWSILSESAYSAAYALASTADYVTVPRTGGAGSIGVVACHLDFSAALNAAGIKVTYIQYGDRKTDGAAEQPLSFEAAAKFQSDIDALGDLFVATVARNRGISTSKVRGTEAGTFLGAAAVGMGLCDKISSPNVAFQSLLKKLS